MRISCAICLFCVLLSGCMVLDEGPASERWERRHGHGYAEPQYIPPPPPQDEPERGHSRRKYRKELGAGREQGDRELREHRDEAQKRKDDGPRKHNMRDETNRKRDNDEQRVAHDRQKNDRSRKPSGRDDDQTRSSDVKKETNRKREIPPADGGREPSRNSGTR